jgi:transcriptional regulator with XRE-family HTH domain
MHDEKEWRAQVGARLRESRIAAKLSQEDAARAIGRTPQLVSAQEAGDSEPKSSQIRILCELYGQSSDYILMAVRTVPVIRTRSDIHTSPDVAAAGILREVLGREGAADPAGR